MDVVGYRYKPILLFSDALRLIRHGAEIAEVRAPFAWVSSPVSSASGSLLTGVERSTARLMISFARRSSPSVTPRLHCRQGLMGDDALPGKPIRSKTSKRDRHDLSAVIAPAFRARASKPY
jgi:hypothetical protein